MAKIEFTLEDDALDDTVVEVLTGMVHTILDINFVERGHPVDMYQSALDVGAMNRIIEYCGGEPVDIRTI